MKHSGQAKILNMSNTFHKNDEFTKESKNFKEILKNQDNQSSRFALDSLANRNPLKLCHSSDMWSLRQA